MVHQLLPSILAATALAASALTAPALAQTEDLAEYFGFDGLEVLKVGRQAGPMLVTDIDGDGLTDIAVVNNADSRLEFHFQKGGVSADNQDNAHETADRINDLPEHWRFQRDRLSVSHEISACVAHDFDGDGLKDIIYTGARRSEVVFVRQVSRRVFEVTRKQRIRGLAAQRNGFAIADLIGDSAPELSILVGEGIHIYPLDGPNLGEPYRLNAGQRVVAFFIEDYDGNGRLDIAGIVPEDIAPIRMWFGRSDQNDASLGAQVRFETPPILEFEPLRFAGSDKASFATLETQSKRLVVYELDREDVRESGNRDASLVTFSFTDPESRERDHAVIDVDGDGLLDLVATDRKANALALFNQVQGKGLLRSDMAASLSELDVLVAGNVDDDAFAELFVLSEKEAVVGRCDVDESGIPFPAPMAISDGHTPVAMSLVSLENVPHLAVVAKKSRQYVVDLLAMDGSRRTVELGAQSRSPETIVALDADNDGRTDLLLFTPGKPMMMLHASDDSFEFWESEDMGQFGLVQAAEAANTTVMDIDGDGRDELLIADKNFVRAVNYDIANDDNSKSGWKVVTQVNALDRDATLVSLAQLDAARLVVADKKNNQLAIMERSGQGKWSQTETLNVSGFTINTVEAGAFSGDDALDILAIGDDGFGVVRLAGRQWKLKQHAIWRSSNERNRQHELMTGDVNGDGFLDLIALDAAEQLAEIFTFSQARVMHYALGFKVFETKLFSGGEPREYQPNAGEIADVTGDGANDLILLSHDRILIYPQTTRDQ